MSEAVAIHIPLLEIRELPTKRSVNRQSTPIQSSNATTNHLHEPLSSRSIEVQNAVSPRIIDVNTSTIPAALNPVDSSVPLSVKVAAGIVLSMIALVTIIVLAVLLSGAAAAATATTTTTGRLLFILSVYRHPLYFQINPTVDTCIEGRFYN
ncbi:unnamed protein product [Rotaria magnacalcarata]|uniref:Uncharacterized protein n=2 Tax=Rotaria magnacalcarata TaxID=392030 RepID=A0A820DQ23_9BILA|nr:unnamed protein product [Rotaria magnacalcarata]CAF4235473.1 unnamed protein product [Rotaria magnacalcarata]CAF4311319.1 unnamed protein product [Rotaria magnacalcarata]